MIWSEQKDYSWFDSIYNKWKGHDIIFYVKMWFALWKYNAHPGWKQWTLSGDQSTH